MVAVNSKTKKVEKTEKAVKNMVYPEQSREVGLGSGKNINPPNPPLRKGGKKDDDLRKGGQNLNLDVIVYDQDGKEAGNLSLPSEIFGLKVNSDLISQAVKAQMANSRQHIAHAKDRSEVRGGGKKPWKQKGTGRARQGSIRSPLWRGGGVVFGPRPERNFKVKINRKTKQTVLNMVLSDKVKANALILLESFDLPEAKTKAFVKMMKTLPVVGKKVLVVFSAKKDNLRRASKNLPSVNQENLEELNLLDILNADTVLTTAEAVKFWQKNK